MDSLVLQLAAAVLLLLLSSEVRAQGASTRDLTKDCILTEEGPRKIPFAFKTCTQYLENTCCLVGHDKDIGDALDALTDVGENCPYSKRTKVPELFQWFCAMCDPDMPDYMVKQNRTVTLDDNSTAVVWRFNVCSSFVRRLMGTNGDEDEVNFGVAFDSFDDCGLRVNEEVVVPSVTYKTPEAFLQGIPPPFIPEWVEIVIVGEDSDVKCFDAAGVARPLVLVLALAVWVASMWGR